MIIKVHKHGNQINKNAAGSTGGGPKICLAYEELSGRCAYLHCIKQHWVQVADLSHVSPDCPMSGGWLPVLVVSEILWAKNVIVRRVPVQQAKLATGNHSCLPGECLIVQCWVRDCPIKRPVVSHLPVVGLGLGLFAGPVDKMGGGATDISLDTRQLSQSS